MCSLEFVVLGVSVVGKKDYILGQLAQSDHQSVLLGGDSSSSPTLSVKPSMPFRFSWELRGSGDC